MILSGITDKAALRMARSRNRAVIGRKTGSIIDVYMSKGQCIARLWPVDQLYEPSPALKRTHDAVIREREIEKRMSQEDIIALKYRALQSRYNWWEVLGRIHLSREFNHPGTTTGTYFYKISLVNNKWRIRFRHDRPCFARLLCLGRKNDGKQGHHWYESTHREAGLENTLRGKEAIVPTETIDRHYWVSKTKESRWSINRYGYPRYTRFIIQTFDIQNHDKLTGESGLYLITNEKPWWIYAPLNPN